MNYEFFTKQIARLAEVFGAKIYTPERMRALWSEVKNLTPEWLEMQIGEFAGSLRHAPLLLEFRDAAARERELENRISKQEYANDAKQFFTSYSQEDTQMLLDTIRKRMTGSLSDENWELFQNQIASVSKSAEKSMCKYCSDSGLLNAVRIKTEANYTFRCHCKKGVEDERRSIPIGIRLTPEVRSQFKFDFETAGAHR